jgi:hypothetical protein
MYCQPPLILIYIEEGKSTFFIIIVIVLFSLYSSSWSELLGIMRKPYEKLRKGKRMSLSRACTCEILRFTLVNKTFEMMVFPHSSFLSHLC